MFGGFDTSFDDIADVGESFELSSGIAISEIPVPFPIKFAQDIFGFVHSVLFAVQKHPFGDDTGFYQFYYGGIFFNHHNLLQMCYYPYNMCYY